MRSSLSARCWQTLRAPRPRFYSGQLPPWRPVSALDEYDSTVSCEVSVLTRLSRWAEREIRPISLRQLTFFGRTLTEPRLISSANYVRTELPTRYVLD